VTTALRCGNALAPVVLFLALASVYWVDNRLSLRMETSARPGQEASSPQSLLAQRKQPSSAAESASGIEPQSSLAETSPNEVVPIVRGEATPEPTSVRKQNQYGNPEVSLYALRTADNRDQLVLEFGGSPESESAVEAGLNWLARHQNKDGSWSDDCLGIGPASVCEQSSACARVGTRYRFAQTGLALLAFQAAGHFDFGDAQYSAHVRQGLDWLVEHQNEAGGFYDHPMQTYMYEHGIATFALAEACALAVAAKREPDKRYMDALRAAVSFIENQQNEDGGWRYRQDRREGSDTSVSGWPVLALKSAREAGIPIKDEIIRKIEGFFKSCEMGMDGRTGYTNRQPHTEATTGVGMLVHQFLLERPDSELVQQAAAYLANHAETVWAANPGRQADYYLWYNCTLAMNAAGGPEWERWNAVIRDLVISRQVDDKGGCARGSWPPDSVRGSAGGRIYTTALAVLTLEVYYRFAHQDAAAGLVDRESRELLRVLMDSPEAEIVDLLASTNPRERWAALVVAQKKMFRRPDEFVALLRDDDETVRREARRTLKVIASSDQFGPPADAVDDPWDMVVACWQKWLERNRLLSAYLTREPEQILAGFTSPEPLERWTAVTAARCRRLAVHEPLIELLGDADEEVRQEARAGLRQLAKTVDFGPDVNGTEVQILSAVHGWSEWLAGERSRWERARNEELRLAKLLIETNPSAARRRLEEIVRKYPDSAAAEESSRLLASLRVTADP
jgi:hypothetical protein